MKRKIKKENNTNNRVNADRYLITYADLLTLLFALFIILYSISRPDNEKMQAILLAMSNVFNPNQIIQGNNLSPEVASTPKAPVIIFPEKPTSIADMQAQVKNKLSKLIDNKSILLEELPDGVKLSIPNKFLFASASATVLQQSAGVLDTIANALADLDMQIQVDGHTDAVPIKSMLYKSNWELSTARAVNMVQELIERGVPQYNLVVRAFGEQRPVADNATEQGRERNRRAEIIVTTKDVEAAATVSDTTELKEL